ncbi:hypothetical protein JNW88_00280 [Micromonospora sp. ATA32]|nr:hypothetical protein [Micromonospora sp. ATA32]
MVDFPPVGRILDEAPPEYPTGRVRYAGASFARVGQVRQRGLMELTHGRKRTHVTIGERFVASLSPDRSGEPRQPHLDLPAAA